MVQIIPQGTPKKPSFGTLLGANISQGLSQGAQFGSKLYENKLLNEYKRQQIEAENAQRNNLLEKEYKLRNELELTKQNKPLNELQEAQKNKYLAQIESLKEQSDFFNSIMGLDKNETDNSKISELTDIQNFDEKNTGKNNFDINKLSDEKLRALAAFEGQPGQKGVIGTMAANFLKNKEKTKEKELNTFQKDREYHSKYSKPVLDAAAERLKLSDTNKAVRQQLRMDIASGNTSGFFPYMVDKLGLESFRNPESARFSNEVKNIFIGSLNDIPGARPNQFLERLLSTAQPQIGRSTEANLSVMDIADFIEDVRDEQAKKELEIGKEDRKELGYAKEDVTERARERMGDYVNKRQEQMAMQIRKRHEDELEDIDLINELVSGNIIPGTYITPRTIKILYLKNNKDMDKAVKEAEKLGLKFPEYLD